ncbi:MAG: class I SAM-dependent methyltransferase [Sphingorhabdus sp.]
MNWYSPITGTPLLPDGHALAGASGERWPLVDGIPYLRIGREALVRQALAALDAGEREEALILLLADQDDWWLGPKADPRQVRALVEQADSLTLREALARLQFGPVADYFLYRWSDPTYLAGLALLEAHWNQPDTAFELACGIGHYLRDLTRRGIACLGADIVFSKCWIASQWVAPDARYVVFDASHPWPIAGQRFDLVMCHDAFYFMPDQPGVADKLRAAVADQGMLAISHIHNASFAGEAMGPVVDPALLASLFPNGTAYDEAELLDALMAATTPTPIAIGANAAVEAFSLIEAGAAKAHPLKGGLAMPCPVAALRRNPLLGQDDVHWPSDLYAREYGGGCYWAKDDAELDPAFIHDPARLRRVVDLPERW